jgi:hypothetical protein
MNVGQLAVSRIPSEIYTALARHQRAEDWELQRPVSSLLSWIKRFNEDFKLHVSEVAIKVANLPANDLSHFRPGHNDFGLRGEITINAQHVGVQPLGTILGYLLHELLHGWQHEFGRPPLKETWHNREFRSKAAECGLAVAPNGETRYLVGGAFDSLVTSCGIELPRTDDAGELIPAESKKKLKGNSRLKKWVCSCERPVNSRPSPTP